MSSAKLSINCASGQLVQVIQYKRVSNDGSTSVFFVVSDLWDEAQKNPNKNIYIYDYSVSSKISTQAKAYMEWNKTARTLEVSTVNGFNDVQPIGPLRIICVELILN